MGSKKLVWCCIAGILLGFLVPVFFPWDRYVTLMLGMIGGLGVGYLLDKRDEDLGQEASTRIANRKAREANRLMERARRGLEDETLRMDEEGPEPVEEDEPEEAVYEAGDDLEPVTDPDEEAEEQARKLNEAEDLLRAARERLGK